MDTTQLALILGVAGVIVAVLSVIVAVLSNPNAIRGSLKNIGSSLKSLLLNVRHPWIAVSAALAILFVLTAPLFVTALPTSLPRYELINDLAIAIPLLSWLMAVAQSARARRWAWLVSMALVGGGAYLLLDLFSWGDALLALLYLLPAILALFFAVSPRSVARVKDR